MALADIYQLIHKQAFLGEVIENVYFYQRLAPSSTSGMLIAAFIDDMLTKIRALQVNAFTTTEVTAFSLGEPTDFDSEPLALTGSYGSDDSLPSFNAIGYSLKVNTRAVRSGSKRIAGIPETVTTRNFITEGEYIGRIETLRLAMGAQVEVDGVAFSPVVVKRTKTLILLTNPPQYRYTLPVAGEPLVVGNVTSVKNTLKISHQVSRGK